MTYPTHLFHLVVPELYYFIINESYSKYNASLSSVNCSRQLFKFKERTMGTSHHSESVRSRGDNLNLPLVSGDWGGWMLQICRTEPLTCGI